MSRGGSKLDQEKQKHIQNKLQNELAYALKEEENKYCADCDAKGPRWASWNIGIFLCIRCAGIHRNLGVHISKVKSVNLDSWTPEQVQSMRVMGNSTARGVYEANIPEHFRRPQSDSALEAFIRAKYDQKRYAMKGWVKPTVDPADLPCWEDIQDIQRGGHGKRSHHRQSGAANNSSSSKPIINHSNQPVKKVQQPSAAANQQSQQQKVSSPNQQQTQQKQQPPKPPPSAMDDLLGLNTPVAPVSQPGGVAANGDGAFDLLGLNNPPTPAVAPTSNTPVASNTPAAPSAVNSNAAATLMPDSGTSGGDATPSGGDAGPKSKNDIMALFGPTLTSPQTSIPPQPQQPLSNFGQQQMNMGVPPQQMQQQFGGMPQQQQQPQPFQQQFPPNQQQGFYQPQQQQQQPQQFPNMMLQSPSSGFGPMQGFPQQQQQFGGLMNQQGGGLSNQFGGMNLGGAGVVGGMNAGGQTTGNNLFGQQTGGGNQQQQMMMGNNLFGGAVTSPSSQTNTLSNNLWQ